MIHKLIDIWLISFKIFRTQTDKILIYYNYITCVIFNCAELCWFGVKKNLNLFWHRIQGRPQPVLKLTNSQTCGHKQHNINGVLTHSSLLLFKREQTYNYANITIYFELKFNLLSNTTFLNLFETQASVIAIEK